MKAVMVLCVLGTVMFLHCEAASNNSTNVTAVGPKTLQRVARQTNVGTTQTGTDTTGTGNSLLDRKQQRQQQRQQERDQRQQLKNLRDQNRQEERNLREQNRQQRKQDRQNRRNQRLGIGQTSTGVDNTAQSTSTQ